MSSPPLRPISLILPSYATPFELFLNAIGLVAAAAAGAAQVSPSPNSPIHHLIRSD